MTLKTSNRLPDYLDHMRQAIADAQTFTEGMAPADFMQDRRTQQAVVMSLIVLGEAATKVMTNTRTLPPAMLRFPGAICVGCATALRTATSTSTLKWFGIPSKPHCLH